MSDKQDGVEELAVLLALLQKKDWDLISDIERRLFICDANRLTHAGYRKPSPANAKGGLVPSVEEIEKAIPPSYDCMPVKNSEEFGMFFDLDRIKIAKAIHQLLKGEK